MPIQSDRVLEIAVILHAHYYKSKGGAVVRELASHQCGWVQVPMLTLYVGLEFVVGCLPCSKRFFSGHYCFHSTQKPTFPNSNSTKNQVDEEQLSGCATSKQLFMVINSFIYLIYLHSLKTKDSRKKKN